MYFGGMFFYVFHKDFFQTMYATVWCAGVTVSHWLMLCRTFCGPYPFFLELKLLPGRRDFPVTEECMAAS